jgi:hypothetical protein
MGLSVSAPFFSVSCALGRPHCLGSHADLIWSPCPSADLLFLLTVSSGFLLASPVVAPRALAGPRVLVADARGF